MNSETRVLVDAAVDECEDKYGDIVSASLLLADTMSKMEGKRFSKRNFCLHHNFNFLAFWLRNNEKER